MGPGERDRYVSSSRRAAFMAKHPKLARLHQKIHPWLPPLNFITLHYAYFLIVSLVTSVIFWGASTPPRSITYVDSLFLTVSAMTEAGLNTVNLSEMNTFQQVLLWLLIILGSTIWVSIWTVLARKKVFENRFEDVVRAERERQRERIRMRRLSRPPSTSRPGILFFHRNLSRARTEPAKLGETSLPAMGRTMPEDGANGTSQAARESLDAVSLDPDLLRQRTPSLLDRRPGSGQAPDDAVGEEGDEKALAPSTSATAAVSSGEHITFATPPRAIRTTSAYQRPHAATRRSSGIATRLDVDSNIDAREDAPPRGDHDKEDEDSHWRTILGRHNVGRNAQFHSLSREERDRLGGCEYRALRILAIVVPLYWVLFQLLGAVAIGAWIQNYMPTTATSNGANPFWAGVFFAISAFNNSGMALLDANAVPFQQAYYVLITMGLLILAGNTAYPLFLRLILWTGLRLLKMVTEEDSYVEWKATLEFILKYPRRVYTNLFPSRATWWLFFMLILTNGIDWIAFEVLNIGNPVIESIPPGPRTLDGLFQALAVRSGGFYIIPISAAYIGLQVLYVIMMYISVYPVVITMRHSNVYEERSLGIYEDDIRSQSDDETATASDSLLPSSAEGEADASPYADNRVGNTLVPTTSRSARPPAPRRQTLLGHALSHALTFQGVGAKPPHPRINASQPREESRVSFVSQQVRSQLAHDLWWLVIAIFIIATIETSHFLDDPATFSVFNIIFEVVSAYGCVGISVGLPTQAYSFSGAWHPGSKLVLCLVMLRGRHRGLPVALDRAVRLPGEHLHREEEEDHRIRKTMSMRRLSIDN